jgi:iron(III) transport system substrate-binding protein
MSIFWLLSSALAAEKSYSKPKDWDQLVEAARKEGTVVIYRGVAFGPGGSLGDVFGKAYPGIKVLETVGGGSQQLNRILTERRAGLHIPDILIGGTTDPVLTLKPAGAVAPLKPLLVLPEVLDPAAWLDNRFWWVDEAEPYVNLMFIGYVQTPAYVNGKTVDPSGFRSYRDILNPKWKGKIVSGDIRSGGQGAALARFIYKNPQLGPEFLERLFGEMDVTFSADHPQMVNWLATGRFPIAMFVSANEVRRARDQGLPVTPVPAEQLQEGAPIAPGSGSISVMSPAPHPNAAKLFLNWLLSREGQRAWQQALRLPSLRVDIPKDQLDPFDVPKGGGRYVSVGTEEYSRIGGTAIRDVVNKALAKAGRQ